MTRPVVATARPTGSGFGRLLVAVYGIFALAASARAGHQLATRASEAPLAYGLSAFAGAVYIAATLALARDRRRAAWTTVSIELVGVVAVGFASLTDARAFPDATVWSGFGAGYGYVPLALPVVGLFWLARTRSPVGRLASHAAATAPTIPPSKGSA